MDYIPVIGDVYRYGKLGYKIGSWIANDEDSYNNRILTNMLDCINRTVNYDDINDIYENTIEAANLFKELDLDNSKKYQNAFALYLAARIFHIWGLCECIIYSQDLKQLKQVKDNYVRAKSCCSKIWEIEKTLFTSKTSIIDQVREMADEKKKEINESYKNWRKQYRCLYKSVHPVKWYLGMWLFA